MFYPSVGPLRSIPYHCHLSPTSDSVRMGSCELEHRRGRWLAPTEFAGLLEEVYNTLLRQGPSAGDGPGHIVLGCRNSDREIYCTTEWSRLAGRPFASTEEQAKEKLWMWLKKQASVPTERRQGASTDPITTPSATTDPTVCNTTDTSLRSESILMRSEVEAVE